MEVPAEETDSPFEPELLSDLADVLPSVPPASQIVLRMHYFEGLSHVEIAEALEISAGPVKSRLSYGLGWLRRAVRKG